jgi:beta-glucosidase
MYLRDVVASVTPPNRVLKRFTKVELEPDESTTVSFQLTQADLEFIGRDNRPTLEDGEFVVMIDELEQSFTLEQ